MVKRKGFTLIELLTVITIIAILSAIIFPVFARAKVSANRASDISSMNTLRSALQLYRADQGGYPPALLGYVTTYSGDPLGNDVIPADKVYGYLWPKRLDSLNVLKPAYNQAARGDVTTGALWPQADPRPIGSAPLLDLNGDGKVDGADDMANSRQAFSLQPVTRPNPQGGNPIEARYYVVSGYDVTRVPVPNNPTQKRYELRYARFWSKWGVSGGSASDDPRQLGYNEPPDSTLITWNSWFRDYLTGVPQRGHAEIVLFVGGAAKPFDSRDIAERSWRILP